MSTTLNNAIWARLAGVEDLTAHPDALAAQQQLAALLGVDDTDETDVPRPAVFNGNYAELVTDFAGLEKPVPYPCVTFRADAGVPDPRFKVEVGHISDQVYSFEIWHKSRSSQLIGNIADAIEQLLDRPRGAPRLPVASGRMFWLELTMELAGPIMDSPNNAWVGLVRYQFKTARY